MFDRVQHFETWGGEFLTSGLAGLMEVIGGNLQSLHLCHVEEISSDSIVQISQNCRNLNTLIFENCSFCSEEDISEESLETKNSKVPLLLELRVFKVISSMPLNLVFMILRRSLNIQTIEMDGDIEMADEDIIKLLEDNSLAKLENLLVYASRFNFSKIIEIIKFKC